MSEPSRRSARLAARAQKKSQSISSSAAPSFVKSGKGEYKSSKKAHKAKPLPQSLKIYVIEGWVGSGKSHLCETISKYDYIQSIDIDDINEIVRGRLPAAKQFPQTVKNILNAINQAKKQRHTRAIVFCGISVWNGKDLFAHVPHAVKLWLDVPQDVWLQRYFQRKLPALAKKMNLVSFLKYVDRSIDQVPQDEQKNDILQDIFEHSPQELTQSDAQTLASIIATSWLNGYRSPLEEVFQKFDDGRREQLVNKFNYVPMSANEIEKTIVG